MAKIDGVSNFPIGDYYKNNVLKNDGKKHREYFNYIAPKIEEGKELLDRLDKAIENCDDPDRKAELKQIEDQLQKRHELILFEPPGAHVEFRQFRANWERYLSKMQGAMIDAQAALQPQDNRDNFCGMPLPELSAPPHIRDAARTATSRVDANAGSESTHSAGGSSNTADVDGGSEARSADSGKWGDVDELLGKLDDDPEAVWDKLEGMDPKQQKLFMMRMQQRMQAINQMFSSVSNLQKSQHDTNKAIINNMRV